MVGGYAGGSNGLEPCLDSLSVAEGTSYNWVYKLILYHAGIR